MKVRKRIIFILLCSIVIVSLIPFSIPAAASTDVMYVQSMEPFETYLNSDVAVTRPKQQISDTDQAIMALSKNLFGDDNQQNYTHTDILNITPMVVAGSNYTIGLKADGTVVTVGYNNEGQCNVGTWIDVLQIDAGNYLTVGLRSDGTAIAVGYNGEGQCNVGTWSDIVQVVAGGDYPNEVMGGGHTVGLRSDGTVVAVGYNGEGQCNVGTWNDIVQVAAGSYHTVGLKSDGTVVAVGNNELGQCNVGIWSDIVQVAAGGGHTVGLKSDGTAVAVGENESGQCNLDSWSDIVQVAAGGIYSEALVGRGHTVGLRSDGSVVAVGYNVGQCNVGTWSDIMQVAAGGHHTVGLRSDGSVVAAGYNDYGQCNFGSWRNVVQVAAGYYYTLGLKSDGTAVAVGNNYYGNCNVSSWSDVTQVTAGSFHSMGLRADGTVVAVGRNNYGQCNVSSWSDVTQVAAGYFHTVGLRSDGTVVAIGRNNYGQCNVETWSDIIQVTAGYLHTVGLRADGTIVAVGSNNHGQCNVSSWNDVTQVAAVYLHTVGLRADGTIVAVGSNGRGECNFYDWNLLCQLKRYAIVVSDSTAADPDWENVVNTLKTRYDGRVFSYESANVMAVKDRLTSFYPTYVCFVNKPLEVTQSFVTNVHQLTRELDSDPYGDAIWAILTGYDAADALRIATGPTELKISNALLKTTGNYLDYLKQGRFYSETEYEVMWVKYPDGTIDKSQPGPRDCTNTLVDLLNTNEYDIMITSGHADEHTWLLHWEPGPPDPGDEGIFRSEIGDLIGVPHNGAPVLVNSANPKIYYAPGNCLTGHISDMDCMALAWLHTGGAYQFCGYTVSNLYGYMGWGIGIYFLQLGDQFTFAESFYLNNQALIFDLINGTPGRDPEVLEYDKDVMAIYGDPACKARLVECKDPLYNQNLKIDPLGNYKYRFTFKIVMNQTGHLNRPPINFLPFRVQDVILESTDAHNVVITDDFVLMHVWQEGDPDLEYLEERQVTFTASLLGMPVLCGDVNDDGNVNMADVMILWYDIAEYPSAGAWTISSEWAADVNCDGKLNMADVMILWYDIADYPSASAWEVNCCE